MVLASATALTLSACGGTEEDAGSSSGSGLTQVTVGYFPLVHTATVVNALEEGLFEEQGLDVELVQTGGGATAIPPLVSGELDITYSNHTSTLIAAQQGLPVQLIAGNDIGANDHAIMVNGDSPLQSPSDLSGARIAVNNLQNIATVAVNAVLEDAGVDISTIEYVEIPFPEMQAAMDSKDVDAIWQVEPFQASALAAGDRVLFPLFSGPVEDMPVAGWISTTPFVQENPEVVEAFRAALEASIEDLDGDREQLVELVPTYTQVPAAVVEQVELPEWNATIDQEQLQKMADLMFDYELIDEEFDVAAVTAAG